MITMRRGNTAKVYKLELVKDIFCTFLLFLRAHYNTPLKSPHIQR